MKGDTMKYATLLILALLPGLVLAHGEEDFAAAEEIIDQKIACEDLSEDDLELIGDYYMEQMHPGEAHEAMDEMMGGEGSESLRQMHINMARSFYCGEHDAMGPQSMQTMMSGGMMGNNMMMGGMMGNNMMYTGQAGQAMMYGSWTFTNTLLAVVIAVLFFGGTYLLMKRR